MSRDDLYLAEAATSGSFEFNETVVEVFPDMLKRSIPGYPATIQMIGALAARYVQPTTQCYDLGCSLGAAALAIRHNVSQPGCRIVAVDNSAAMVARCRELVAADPRDGPEILIIQDDIQQVEIADASMVVMNYTLQFLAPQLRDEMMRKIGKALVPGGIFVLSEKVVNEDESMEEMLVDLHHDFKRRNQYSDLEISRKRTAIENILVPDTTKKHFERLEAAGFRHVGICLRYFNFVSIVATR